MISIIGTQIYTCVNSANLLLRIHQAMTQYSPFLTDAFNTLRPSLIHQVMTQYNNSLIDGFNTLLPSLMIFVVQHRDAENRFIAFGKEILQPNLRRVIESLVPSHKGRCRPRWHCTKDLETKEAAFPLSPPPPPPSPLALLLLTSPIPLIPSLHVS